MEFFYRATDAVHLNRLRNVLEALRAEILKSQGQLSLYLIISLAGNPNAAGLGQAFQPRGDVHPITVDVIAIDNHIAQMYADSEQHLAVFGHTEIAGSDLLLNRRSTANRLDHTAEFGQDAVTHHLYDTPAMLDDRRFN